MILSVCAQKGGAGKTSLAVALAGEAQHQGKPTLLIDLDPQSSAISWFRAGSGEAWPRVLQCSSDRLRDAVIKGYGVHDVCVIDCPPQQHLLTREALFLSHLAIIPIQAGALDLWTIQQHTIPLLQEVWKVRPDLRALFVVSRVQPRTRAGKEIRASLAGLTDPRCSVAKAQITHRIAWAEMPTRGILPHQSRDKLTHADVERLYKEIFG